ncbi:DUF6415 family natural product biosynthesis protein [Streptomyces sp. NPDC047974]|uniref:DUF6415 family natural product biosynthesis protein n=1 Tax=Streptomyces sp. NPDC047974 TaxID=3154343 RepID=UPI0033C7BD5B
MKAAAHTAAKQVPDRTDPLDARRMRETARRALGEGAEALSPEQSDSLTQALRGMLMVAIPEVTAAADRYPKGDMPRICALAGVEEASRRLRARPVRADSPWALRHAQRLARSVMALTDHYVNLGGQA